MGRCKKKRCCRLYDDQKIFKPIGIPMDELELTELGADEFEAMRLCDLENLNQDEAGKKMEISRGTIQRLLSSGRTKMLTAILENKAIKIIRVEDKNETMSTNNGK